MVTTSRVRIASRIARGEVGVGASPSDLDQHARRRVLAHACVRGADQDRAADARAELRDHLAQRGREEVDAAHDQQVVGAADAAHAERAAPARARLRVDHDAVAAAEAQHRHRLAAQRGVDELALGAVLERQRLAADSGSISSTWTWPSPEKCMPACSSHSPHSEGETSAIPIASRTVAPNASSIAWRVASSPPPGSPATREQRARRARAARCRARGTSRRGRARRRACSRAPRRRAPGRRARAARCCRCRPGSWSRRCGPTRRAPRRPRTGPSCR